MSTPDTGDAALVRQVVDDAKELIDGARAEAAEQLDMLDPITPEEMLEAREALGPRAGNLSVLAHAREKRRGRPPGSRNKRTDDFARYILGFGQHPAITLMQIQSTPPEVLIENSRRLRRRRRTDTGIEIDVMQTMTYDAALSLKVRCAEALMPYLESKKPVAVDMSFSGVADLFIAGVTHSQDEIDTILEGEFEEFDAAAADGRGEAA
ncbi:hypothetical protein BH09PSE4_BH09PSE4_22520 [soil metagenome]